MDETWLGSCHGCEATRCVAFRVAQRAERTTGSAACRALGLSNKWHYKAHDVPACDTTIALYAELAAEPSVAAPSVVDTIERDIDRTFPRHVLFAGAGAAGQAALLRVLRAYAGFDKDVGYCQGMGFIAALFLSYMPEEVRASHNRSRRARNVVSCNRKGLTWQLLPVGALDFPSRCLLQSAFFLLRAVMQGVKYRLCEVFGPGMPRVKVSLYQFEVSLVARVDSRGGGVAPESVASPFHRAAMRLNCGTETRRTEDAETGASP